MLREDPEKVLPLLGEIFSFVSASEVAEGSYFFFTMEEAADS